MCSTHRQTYDNDLDGGAHDLEQEKDGKVGVLQSALVVHVQLLVPFDAKLALKIMGCFGYTRAHIFFYITITAPASSRVTKKSLD